MDLSADSIVVGSGPITPNTPVCFGDRAAQAVLLGPFRDGLLLEHHSEFNKDLLPSGGFLPFWAISRLTPNADPITVHQVRSLGPGCSFDPTGLAIQRAPRAVARKD